MNSIKPQPGDEGNDAARASLRFSEVVSIMQSCVSSIERCRVPVIAALHGFVIGGGVDISSTCDIRYAAKDTKFTIKEVDLGLAADIGTVQRF